MSIQFAIHLCTPTCYENLRDWHLVIAMDKQKKTRHNDNIAHMEEYQRYFVRSKKHILKIGRQNLLYSRNEILTLSPPSRNWSHLVLSKKKDSKTRKKTIKKQKTNLQFSVVHPPFRSENDTNTPWQPHLTLGCSLSESTCHGSINKRAVSRRADEPWWLPADPATSRAVPSTRTSLCEYHHKSPGNRGKLSKLLAVYLAGN